MNCKGYRNKISSAHGGSYLVQLRRPVPLRMLYPLQGSFARCPKFPANLTLSVCCTRDAAYRGKKLWLMLRRKKPLLTHLVYCRMHKRKRISHRINRAELECFFFSHFAIKVMKCCVCINVIIIDLFVQYLLWQFWP